MEMKKINSGRLRDIGNDSHARILQVRLNDGSTLQYGGVGEDTWRRLSGSGAAWSFYRDNIEEEFAAKRVSGNGHREAATPHNETRHARSPLLNPLGETTSHSTRLQTSAAKSLVIPQAGEEENESLREFHVTVPAAKNPLDELFRKP